MYPEYLYHFGVKGMKWGVRKKREYESQNRRYSTSQRKSDNNLFGKRGVHRINRRMNKGKTYKQAKRSEWVTQLAKGIAGVSAISIGAFVAANPDGTAKAVSRTVSKGAKAVNSILQAVKDAKYYKYTDIGTIKENGEFIAKLLLK